MFSFLTDRDFLKRFSQITLPIALQEFLIASLGIIDTIMIGRTGGTNMAAVNLANQPFFILFLVLMAITSGASVFTAQYWGNKNLKGLSRAFGLSFIGSITLAIIGTIICIIFSENILHFYSKDPVIIKGGVSYLKIVSFSFIFSGATVSLSALLRSTKQPKIPLIVSMLSIAINTGLNYILIFGKFGAPEMGIKGAAIATIISRIIETLTLYAILIISKNPATPIISEITKWSSKFITKYAKTAVPVLINDVGWVTGFSLYQKAYAAVSTDAIIATTVTGSAAYLFLVLFLGTGHATGAILGNLLGENRLDETKKDAINILHLIIILALLMSIVMALTSSIIPNFYNVSESVKYSANMLIIIFAFALPFKVINMNIIAGVLRSGGDTRFAAAIDVGAVWLIGVPIAFFTAVKLHYPIEMVFALVMIEEVVKNLVAIYRMYTWKWINKVI